MTRSPWLITNILKHNVLWGSSQVSRNCCHVYITLISVTSHCNQPHRTTLIDRTTVKCTVLTHTKLRRLSARKPHKHTPRWCCEKRVFFPRDYTKTGRASVHATRGATKANKTSAKPKEHHSIILDEHSTQCVKLHLLFTQYDEEILWSAVHMYTFKNKHMPILKH